MAMFGSHGLQILGMRVGKRRAAIVHLAGLGPREAGGGSAVRDSWLTWPERSERKNARAGASLAKASDGEGRPTAAIGLKTTLARAPQRSLQEFGSGPVASDGKLSAGNQRPHSVTQHPRRAGRIRRGVAYNETFACLEAVAVHNNRPEMGAAHSVHGYFRQRAGCSRERAHLRPRAWMPICMANLVARERRDAVALASAAKAPASATSRPRIHGGRPPLVRATCAARALQCGSQRLPRPTMPLGRRGLDRGSTHPPVRAAGCPPAPPPLARHQAARR